MHCPTRKNVQVWENINISFVLWDLTVYELALKYHADITNSANT